MIKIAAVYKFKRACVFAIVCKMVMARRTLLGEMGSGGDRPEASLEVLHKPYLSSNKMIKSAESSWEGSHLQKEGSRLAAGVGAPALRPWKTSSPTHLRITEIWLSGGCSGKEGRGIQVRGDLGQCPGSALPQLVAAFCGPLSRCDLRDVSVGTASLY